MAYVPNAFDATQPTEEKFVESAALEFRTSKDAIIRSLRFPAADVEANRGELPVAASRASRYLAFDSNGVPIAALASPGSVPVSSFGEDLIAAADAAAARALLDVPSVAEVDADIAAVNAIVAAIPGRNKIINGKMEILQRGASFVSPASATYTLDRWVWGNTSAGAVTISHQSADAPSSEFRSSLRVAVTTADAAIAAGDIAYIGQRIEGYNVRDLVGRTFVVSFWVRSSEVGTHAVALRNSGSDRSYVATYTVIAADTWEKKSFVVTGGLITAGTWDWTNGVGLYLDFVLAAGTTFQTTAGAWQTGSFLGVAGAVNVLDTIGNIFAITGVQVEVGAVATQFEHRPHGYELSLCQRYYCVFNAIAGAAYSTAASSAGARAPFYYPVTMRAAPLLGAGTATLVNATDALIGVNATSGYYTVVQGAAAGNYNGQQVNCTANAELV